MAFDPMKGALMTQVAEKLKTQLAELQSADRAELAQFLIGSLDNDADSEASSMWKVEISRRVAEIKSGKAIGISADEVFELIRQKYS
jgi:putative addiction module component (TIGR02574 family)